MVEAVVALMLSVCAWEDWRTKKITVWHPVSCAGVGVVMGIAETGWRTVDFWLGVFFGCFLAAAAAVSGNRFGLGDGTVLAACGICLGGRLLLLILLIGMMLFLMVGVTGIIVGKWNGKKELCFVPFLWAAFILIWLVGGS